MSHDTFKINTNIFVNPSSECKQTPNIVYGCKALGRLITALQYFHSMDTSNVATSNDIFIQFMCDSYGCFLDDYLHLVMEHVNDLTSIYQQLLESNSTILSVCKNLKDCESTSRHYKGDYINDTLNDDNFFIFYRNTLDSLHFYLLHQFHAGLRVRVPQRTGGGYCDDGWDEILKSTRATSFNTEHIARFTKGEKFQVTTSRTESNTSFLDALFCFLINIAASDAIDRLRAFLIEEEFDSDCIHLDLVTNTHYYGQSNISDAINSKHVIDAICQFIETNNSMSNTP